MGVPALFRWLSKKYPKIIYPVVEEEEVKVQDENNEEVSIPLNSSHPNPNGVEFDNLYLDMNGIVHPCTHPEGKPAPETEEEMMVEIFQYTERVVNMIRPRKLLFMAIDGVAPRAKMNQQRSRRFRSAQEAKDKEEARKEAVLMWESMGKTLSEEEKNVKAWDSNAITPGTPFMDLLAKSLKYWVVRKMNTDPGWKQLQVIISDSSVPGEGEHKIMDFIRRQRVNPGHDPNSHHVIYGLDADLIMLALATHEPHFRVLREDVFGQDTSPTACRMCGQEGHYAAQCTATKPAEVEKKPDGKKAFIFLDVAILREYLEVELNVPHVPFPFNLEQAIDDWVLLIFFVGNDFLPHLPSLEIREGAIDVLLEIWKSELSRMGGYLTNHGQIQLFRAQLILEGLALRENQIFQRRREAEERREQNAKHRKVENGKKHVADVSEGPSPALALTAPPTAPGMPSAHPSLPQRPSFAANADSIGFGATQTAESIQEMPVAAQALAGSNHDVVANRRAIRLANMSAAEMLKAELGGLVPVKTSAFSISPSKPPADEPVAAVAEDSMEIPGLSSSGISQPAVIPSSVQPDVKIKDDGIDVYGANNDIDVKVELDDVKVEEGGSMDEEDMDAEGDLDEDFPLKTEPDAVIGTKRKIDEADEDEDIGNDDDEDEDEVAGGLALKVNPDGSVEQEDTVKLWEPGYRDRYYRQKFGVEPSDTKFKQELTKRYIEGLSWVLQYYYQGTPSWQWYYPYHFAPFAADFENVDKMDIRFELGQPFKPFEQLMGVFPAASRQHIPDPFHPLMTDDNSPIIDFYPPTFEIDMNGKKMLWQGVALLPFIDEKRLLDAMRSGYEQITDEEKHRNKWGNNVMFASVEHSIYPFFETLYGKRKNQDPVIIDSKLSKGINGSVLANPDCLPGSTYESHFTQVSMPHIKNDRSLSALYFFPQQITPHRSVLLSGVRRPPRTLTTYDVEKTRRGRGGGRGGPPRNDSGRGGMYGGSMFHSSNGSNERGFRGRGGPPHQQPYSSSYPPSNHSSNQRQPYSQQNYGGYGSYGQGNRPPASVGYGSQNQYAQNQHSQSQYTSPSSRGLPSRGGTPGYNNHGQNNYGYGSGSGGGSRGSYGGYGDGYGGYIGNRGGSNGSSNSSYGPPRGGSYNSSRARGRGW